MDLEEDEYRTGFLKAARDFPSLRDASEDRDADYNVKTTISQDRSDTLGLEETALSSIRTLVHTGDPEDNEAEADLTTLRGGDKEGSDSESWTLLKQRTPAQGLDDGDDLRPSTQARSVARDEPRYEYRPLRSHEADPAHSAPLPTRVEELDQKVDDPLLAATTSAKVNRDLDQELYGDGPYSHLFQHLLQTVSKLKAEKAALQKEVEDTKFRLASMKPILSPQSQEKDGDLQNVDQEDSEESSGLPPDPEKKEPQFIYETFHMVNCSVQKSYYRDVPRKFKGDSASDHLRGQDEIENCSGYLEHNPNTAFAILYTYSCDDYTSGNKHRSTGYKAGQLIQDAPQAISTGQIICAGGKLVSALTSIITANPDRFEGFTTTYFHKYFNEPYYLFYVHNKTFLELAESSGLDEDDKARLKLLCNWMEENWRADWDEADELLSRGKINTKHYSKLFRPDEMLVTFLEDGIISASKVKQWPWSDNDEKRIETYHWNFNGTFRKEHSNQTLRGSEIITGKGEVDIKSLSIYPLRFADPGIYGKLSARGDKFWTCRKMRIICYRETDKVDPTEAERRFIVDYNIFRRMHRGKAIFSSTQDDLTTEEMESDQPPEGDFLALLPPYIHGFNLQEKSWMRLRVDRITDVTWNKDAFKRLVVPEETKELIQALVTAQVSQVRTAPDIIAGKGNGLIILLHGGPGTGKTLTAESIAELEERPLYRVTCGDIGMEPEDVENYLEATLSIGKAWGCVVLLDEADVFIEERSLADLKRNALISVFLRVLEYYDGILVLTTNRVGTFDEAFKSRIQLALRYPNLDEAQRVEIWRNFFRMLRGTKERVDLDDLEMNVGQLAVHDINGRQIRNAVTMARHLATFRRERLVYRHVQAAIRTVSKFDEYLLEVKGVSDDSWARADKLR